MLACASVRECPLSYEAAGAPDTSRQRGRDGRNGCAHQQFFFPFGRS